MKAAAWLRILHQNVTSLESLLAICHIESKDREKIGTPRRFSLNVPMRIVSKMRKGTIEDPLFRQFVPLAFESENFIGEIDPLREREAVCSGLLLQKYARRALILVTNCCAMHCRFCFRQHCDFTVRSKRYEEELSWIEKDENLEEIILSGGDPLSLRNSSLHYLLARLDKINHVQRIRIHTRFPIGIPERIDDQFIETLNKTRKQKIIVLHINHVEEIDEEVAAAIERLKKNGILLLAQSVLLRGINDTSEALRELYKALIRLGVVPYYLHQLDRLPGILHYEVPINEASVLMKQLHESLPGYMVPRLAQEVAGEKAKIIYPTYASFSAD